MYPFDAIDRIELRFDSPTLAEEERSQKKARRSLTNHGLKTRRKTRHWSQRRSSETDREDISSPSSVAIEKCPLVKETTAGWSEVALAAEMVVYQCSDNTSLLLR
ncbi:Uncharacterized protein Rs2_18187 [Raphanus sativus]|nr:Uncharacterized protein Rs2_18187 [Raphanus sativus]